MDGDRALRRAFGAAYGMTPREYRHAALTRTAPAPPPGAQPPPGPGHG
ncbi:helix-turn-helix transcriptional regulator [Streptomyces sp. WMMC500]|nr:helix-turn-helix transcriptional regulator [Streptomyces sp. WMMC500]WBB61796.1 helix-turn-helix transcriptional regulator [Streptomyces sp. WMMC500]